MTERDIQLEEFLWTQEPSWACPRLVKADNLGIRDYCRICGYDSNCGEFPWYNPLPPYDAVREEPSR